MKFLVLTDEQAYDAAAEMPDCERDDLDASVIFSGTHPEHGKCQIIIPVMGRSALFSAFFKTVPIVLLE